MLSVKSDILARLHVEMQRVERQIMEMEKVGLGENGRLVLSSQHKWMVIVDG